MKKVITVTEVDGLEGLLNKTVTLFCCRYIYTGKLTGLNNTCVLLENPKIVYETGPLDTKEWTDAQPLPNSWYIARQSIESFGILK